MRYMTFPVLLFNDGMGNIRETVSKIFNYCLYDHCERDTGHSIDGIKRAEYYFGLNYGNNRKAHEEGEILFESIPEKSPKASVRVEILLDYYKNPKTDFQVICLYAFAGIRSVIQRQKFKKMTNLFLLGRMAGNSKAGEELPQWIKRYCSRYHLEKIKLALQANWGLKYYASNTRGFYVSFSLPLNQLALIAERSKMKYKAKRLAEQQREAKREALSILYNSQNNSTYK